MRSIITTAALGVIIAIGVFSLLSVQEITLSSAWTAVVILGCFVVASLLVLVPSKEDE